MAIQMAVDLTILSTLLHSESEVEPEPEVAA